jgi:hypothetical protein
MTNWGCDHHRDRGLADGVEPLPMLAPSNRRPAR